MKCKVLEPSASRIPHPDNGRYGLYEKRHTCSEHMQRGAAQRDAAQMIRAPTVTLTTTNWVSPASATPSILKLTLSLRCAQCL